MRETSGDTRVRPSLVDTRWLLIGNIVLFASSAGWMVAHASGTWAPPLLALLPVDVRTLLGLLLLSVVALLALVAVMKVVSRAPAVPVGLVMERSGR